jgi:hypothetical protein
VIDVGLPSRPDDALTTCDGPAPAIDLLRTGPGTQTRVSSRRPRHRSERDRRFVPVRVVHVEHRPHRSRPWIRLRGAPFTSFTPSGRPHIIDEQHCRLCPLLGGSCVSWRASRAPVVTPAVGRPASLDIELIQWRAATARASRFRKPGLGSRTPDRLPWFAAGSLERRRKPAGARAVYWSVAIVIRVGCPKRFASMFLDFPQGDDGYHDSAEGRVGDRGERGVPRHGRGSEAEPTADLDRAVGRV